MACAVRLVLQASEEEPAAALRRLGIPITAPPPTSPSGSRSAVVESQQRVVQMLWLAGCAEESKESAPVALDDAAREVVRGMSVDNDAPRRNRALFLTSVLVTDATCAAALSRCGACDVLCRALHPSGGAGLSVAEKQWAMLSVSELAAHAATASTVLAAAWLPAISSALGDAPAAACDVTSAAGAVAAGESGDDIGGTPSPEAECDARPALVGLRYAAIAVLANLALYEAGAEAVLRASLLPVLLNALTAERGTLSLPTCRWLFAGRRTALLSASLGGGASRALLNMASSSWSCLVVLRSSGVMARISELCSNPAASANVHKIASAVRDFIRTVPPAHTLKAPSSGAPAVRVGTPTSALLTQAEVGTPLSRPPSASADAHNATAATAAAAAVADVAQPGKSKRARSPALMPGPQTSSLARDGQALARGGAAAGAASCARGKQPRRQSKTHAKGAEAEGGAIGADEELEFDRILSRRLHRGRIEYLVKWKRPRHAGDAASTWEPIHHIHDPTAAVSHDLGDQMAAAYDDWAWTLDPRGAGWSVTPMLTLDAETPDPGPQLPENWPASVTYAPFLLWECSRPALLRLRASSYVPLAGVRIRPLPPSHPAAGGGRGGFGLFARCALPCGTLVGDFTGVVKPQAPHDRSKYLLEVFHDVRLGLRLDVDAEHFGNETRFINDFCGVTPSPNVAFSVYRHHATGELAVGVTAIAAIPCGAELTVDYGQSFWAVPPGPLMDKASPPLDSAAPASPAASEEGSSTAGGLPISACAGIVSSTSTDSTSASTTASAPSSTSASVSPSAGSPAVAPRGEDLKSAASAAAAVASEAADAVAVASATATANGGEWCDDATEEGCSTQPSPLSSPRAAHLHVQIQ